MTISSSSVSTLPSSSHLATGTGGNQEHLQHLSHLQHYHQLQHHHHHHLPPTSLQVPHSSIPSYYDRSNCYVSDRPATSSTVVPNQRSCRQTLENKESNYNHNDYQTLNHSLHDASDQSNCDYVAKKRKKRYSPTNAIGGDDGNDNNIDDHDYADKVTREQYVKYRNSEHGHYYNDNNNNNNRNKNNNDDSNNNSSSSSIRIGRIKIQN
ncbi:probable serine/threonine-protein kinase DDB_G0282963 [Wyeomyia smithii]|uniref:probable serine/threonine-protein kinase DDB_G0282963 n=1 Tax=Wyeomyia smithii TaxID=174621 RepID=UPI002467E464|nr:probable serine/threonine-protein kinase DDB_G0282963 [Wyeomyia smithii]